MEQELAALSAQAASLKSSITASNEAYMMREEALCEQIAQLNQQVQQTEHDSFTPAELSQFQLKIGHTAELQRDVEDAERRLAIQHRETEFARVAKERIQAFLNDAASAATDSDREVRGTLERLLVFLSKHNASLTTSSSTTDKSPLTEDLTACTTLITQWNAAIGSDFHESASPQIAGLRKAVTATLPLTFLDHQSAVVTLRVDLELLCTWTDAMQRALRADTASLHTRESDGHSSLSRLVVEERENSVALDEINDALLALNREVGLLRSATDADQQRLKAIEAEISSLRSASDGRTTSQSELQQEVAKLQEAVMQRQMEAQRESERERLATLELSLATDRDIDAQRSLDEALETVAQRTKAKHDAEREKVAVNRATFHAEETTASHLQRIQKLNREIEDANHVLDSLQQQRSQLVLREEADAEAARVLHRELSALTSVENVTSERENMLEMELKALDKRIAEVKSERATLRRSIVSKEAQLAELTRAEASALEEVMYCQRLMPKTHPFARRSKKLQLRMEALQLAPPVMQASDSTSENNSSAAATARLRETEIDAAAAVRKRQLLAAARRSFEAKQKQMDPPGIMEVPTNAPPTPPVVTAMPPAALLRRGDAVVAPVPDHPLLANVTAGRRLDRDSEVAPLQALLSSDVSVSAAEAVTRPPWILTSSTAADRVWLGSDPQHHETLNFPTVANSNSREGSRDETSIPDPPWTAAPHQSSSDVPQQPVVNSGVQNVPAMAAPVRTTLLNYRPHSMTPSTVTDSSRSVSSVGTTLTTASSVAEISEKLNAILRRRGLS